MSPDFRVLFESVPGLYVVLTPQFRIVAASDAFLRATMTERSEILGRDIFDVFPDNPDDPDATGVSNLRASLKRVLKNRAPDTMAVQKYDIPRPDSCGGGFEERYWSPLNSPVYGPDGAVTHIIHRVEDVTEFVRLKQQGQQRDRATQELRLRTAKIEAEIFQRAKELQDVNRQLRAANRALEEADRAKTTFFSNVSHEFRTPLTLMLGPLEDLLARPAGTLAESFREELRVVYRNGLRLLKLVNALLDFSRLEAGRLRAVYRPTELGTFTAELASQFRSACERAGVQLNIDCSSLPEPVYVDRDMWEKIVFNLLSNAFKFTFEGMIAVHLHQAADGVELVVQDTGTGISEEHLPHLFERFHRIEGAKSRAYEGTGIGLSLVQELVRLHGGSVRVESIYGNGSTFIVSLPLGCGHLPRERVFGEDRTRGPRSPSNAFIEEALRWLPKGVSASDREPAGDSDQVSPSDDPTARDRPRILVAEDNADMRDYIRRLLSHRYDVETVADGGDALRAIRRSPPDLVLTDSVLSVVDGFGLLQALRADPATCALPVLMLSARAGEDACVGSLEAGANDYLVKPFSARELLARVGTHLEMARLHRIMAETREAARRKDEFLATLAHELRNPLAPIRNALHIMRLSSKFDTDGGRIHDMLERQVNHMVRLVDDLLDVSRITRGKVELRMETVDLAEVVHQAVETSQALIETAGHQLTIDLPAEPLRLQADPVRLTQVVANLLNNAAKFTDRGGHLILSARLQEGGELRLSVRDNGRGIAADMLDRIFDLFVQADRTQGGLGIGLTLARELVHLHGGRVEVHSAGVGHGSEFVVYLPWRQESTPATIADPGCREVGPMAKQRILVVDDNCDAADSLAMLLGIHGAEVQVAHDGQSALECLAEFRPAIAILDIGMPGMDGYALARCIRENPELRNIQLIALTGWGQEEDRRRSRLAGFDHHLVKPVDFSELQALIS